MALRAGEVPRAARRHSRSLLALAYEALEADRPTVALVRAVEARAHPLAPRIPRATRPISALRPDLAISAVGLAERVAGHGAIARDIERRVERFLAVGEAEPLGARAAPRPMEGHELDVELTYTEG